MSVISARIVRRIIEVSRGPEPANRLLERVGLAADPTSAHPGPPIVPAEAYYDLLERCGAQDPTLPLRYGQALQPEDFGAFGLAIKTATDVRDALQRLSRYILLVSDTLEYTLVEHKGAYRFVLRGRPANGRLGIQLANACAFAAIVSLLRQAADGPVVPDAVSFRHPAHPEASAYEAWFGGPLHFRAPLDALHLTEATLATPTHLADEGLSAFLLAQVADQHAQLADGAVVQQVRVAITDTLCPGMPTRDRIARQLGMSARTLHRRLAERGHSFQGVANQVRREVAESLLARPTISLAEVAYLTGFSDQSAFQRAFKAWTGHTPNRFRQGVA